MVLTWGILMQCVDLGDCTTCELFRLTLLGDQLDLALLQTFPQSWSAQDATKLLRHVSSKLAQNHWELSKPRADLRFELAANVPSRPGREAASVLESLCHRKL